MKPSACLFCLLLLVSMNAGVQAQYSARQLTRKIVPQQPDQQQPNRPAQPGPAYPAVRAAAPVAPESDKVRANREEAARKAVEFQKKRAEEGSPQAQYDLGVRYLKGDGVPKNEVLGREWLQKSAKNGSPHAQRKLDELPPLSAAAIAASKAPIPTPSATTAIARSASDSTTSQKNAPANPGKN